MHLTSTCRLFYYMYYFVAVKYNYSLEKGAMYFFK